MYRVEELTSYRCHDCERTFLRADLGPRDPVASHIDSVGAHSAERLFKEAPKKR